MPCSRHFRYFLAVLLMIAPLWNPAQAASASPPVTAFVHVNIVPMDSERVLHDQTVIVQDGLIRSIGANSPVPDGARVIDGGGRQYLSPGLADLHIHSDSRNDMAVYLANGVTTVLTMGGQRAGFVDTFVPRANSGIMPSPRIYTSFLVDGTPEYNGFVIRTPEEARAIVRLARANNYDFIKVYVNLAPPVFEALADEARQQKVPLVGHGVYSVRLPRQLELGQALIAHSEEFFYAYFTPPGHEESDVPPDDERIAQAVELARRHDATIVADLVTYHAIQAQIGHPERVTAALARPETSLLSPEDRLAWLRSGYPAKTANLGAKYQFLRRLVRAFSEAGVALVTGTDAPAVPTLLPGYSLHDNLAELQAAGLSSYQALATATREAGAFIARTRGGTPFGTVSVGSRADLILSNDNPLQLLEALRTPAGVMVQGRWHDAPALAALLAEVRASYCRASLGCCDCTARSVP